MLRCSLKQRANYKVSEATGGWTNCSKFNPRMASDLILLMANAQSEYMASSSKGTDPRRGSISYRFGFDSFQLTGLVDAEESDFPWDVKLNT